MCISLIYVNVDRTATSTSQSHNHHILHGIIGYMGSQKVDPDPIRSLLVIAITKRRNFKTYGFVIAPFVFSNGYITALE